MRIITTALLSAGLMLGTASLAHAQLGFLKDAAKKAATDAAKDKILGEPETPEPQAIQTPLGEVPTGALGNSGVGSITSPNLSTGETLKAGKVLLGGGSTTDVATTIAKDRAKAQGKELLNQQISGAAGSFGSGKKYEATPAETAPIPAPVEAAPLVTPAPAPAAPVNCPEGTKAQADGTCMVTGDWDG